MLSGAPAEVTIVPVDEYSSKVCAQLESLEKSLVSPRLPGKGAGRNSRTKSPKALVIRERRDADDVTVSSEQSGPTLQSAVL